MLVIPDTGGVIGGQLSGLTNLPLSWPDGVVGRAAGSGWDIVNASGQVLAHSGQDAHVGGGEGGDHTWWACGDTTATFPIP